MSFLAFLVAFGGGVFGAAIGALPAFIMVGFLVLTGVAVQFATGNADFFAVPFGAFGPHVGGFASGVAAAAYAANRDKFDNGRDITAGMMGLNSPDILLVGGIFGGLGYLINWIFGLVGFPWTDSVALTVVVSAIIVRVLWGKSGVFGAVVAGEGRYSPSEAYRWVPWQSSFGQKLMIGLGAGLFSTYLALSLGPAGAVLGFGISAASLVFLQYGTKVPVTHHITLVAAVAAAASGSYIWGTLFGILAAFVGEFMANTFCAWGDTHIDPPAATIATLTSLSLLIQA
ncbi:MAG: permease, partial [Anaerolineae bacterium]|nr:permease [Anaerolineae bacterium]